MYVCMYVYDHIFRCEKLSPEREMEQVEIEIPASVYNTMQRHMMMLEAAAPAHNSRRAHAAAGGLHMDGHDTGVLSKLRKLFLR